MTLEHRPRMPLRKASAAAVATLLTLTACSGGRNENAQPAGDSRFDARPAAAAGKIDKVVWNSPYGEPTTMDPVRAYNGQNKLILQNLCEPLLSRDASGQASPHLAEDLKMSADGLTYTVTIRHGVSFWDGTPMTAEDVAFSLNRVRDKETGSFLADAFSGIASVASQGDSVIVRLTKPDALIPAYLAGQGGVVISKAFAEKAGTTYGTPDGGIMCTGPFELDEAGWTPGQPITLIRNDGYWDADSKPLVKQIQFQFITDAATLTNALKTGAINGTFQVPGSAITALQGVDGQVYHARGAATLNMLVVGDHSPLGDPAVRRALSLAIDRAQIASSIWAGAAEPLRTTAPPSSWISAKDVYAGAHEAEGNVGADIAGAQEAIKSAASTDGDIRIAVPAQTENYVRLAEVVQAAAKQIGLNVVIDSMPTASYGGLFADPAARAGYAALFAEIPLYIPEAASVYRDEVSPTGVYNYLGYTSAKVTDALAEAISASDPVERAKATVEAQKVITADLPWVPIVSPDETLFLNDRLGGDVLTANAWYPFAAHLGAK
jgi:peptide/nickel transport system substrate-binding protein